MIMAAHEFKMFEDLGGDRGCIEADFGHQLFVTSLFNEHVGDAAIEDRDVIKTVAEHECVDDHSKAAVDRMFFDRDDIFVRHEYLSEEIGVERFDEDGVDHGCYNPFFSEEFADFQTGIAHVAKRDDDEFFSRS